MNGSKHVEDPTENSHAKSSSFLDNLYLNKSDADDDTDEDAEEITSTRKRGANKIYEEKQTYPDLKTATDSLRKLGWIKGKNRKDKQLLRCKRGCPKALFCQLTKNGITAYIILILKFYLKFFLTPH